MTPITQCATIKVTITPVCACKSVLTLEQVFPGFIKTDAVCACVCTQACVNLSSMQCFLYSQRCYLQLLPEVASQEIITTTKIGLSRPAPNDTDRAGKRWICQTLHSRCVRPPFPRLFRKEFWFGYPLHGDGWTQMAVALDHPHIPLAR